MLLEECGFRVVEALDGKQAVSLAAAVQVDMLVLGLRMPVMDGYAAARRIRKLPGLDKVPLVAYTAKHSYTLSDDALNAGFDEYIVKPVTFEMMRELVDRYFTDGSKVRRGMPRRR